MIRDGRFLGSNMARKAYPKRRPRREWTRQELKQLAALAKRNTPIRVISLKIGRAKTAVTSKARREGILLRKVHRLRLRNKERLTRRSRG